MATDEAAEYQRTCTGSYGRAKFRHWRRPVSPLRATNSDRERYQRLRALAAEIMTEHAGANMLDIDIFVDPTIRLRDPKAGRARRGISGRPESCWRARQRISIDGHCREAGRM